MSSVSKFSNGTVTSKDGTKIGYLAAGQGPGLVLIHGGMATSSSITTLGELLSNSFSVFMPDRRGRGMSGPADQTQGLDKDVEDIDALLKETGAHKVFGVSAGAIVALQAALELPAITQVALFEPPIPVEGTSPTAWVPRYERELAQRKFGAALATIMKGTEGIKIPRFLLVPMMNRNLRKLDARARERGLGPMSERAVFAMRRDIRIVEDSRGPLTRFSLIRSDILLLGGAKSPRYAKAALDALAAVLPKAHRVTIPGVSHAVATNKGKPEIVATELRKFFS